MDRRQAVKLVGSFGISMLIPEMILGKDCDRPTEVTVDNRFSVKMYFTDLTKVNGHIYPSELWESAIASPDIQTKLVKLQMYGTYVPDTKHNTDYQFEFSDVTLDRVSHVITDISYQVGSDYLTIDGKILPSRYGNMLIGKLRTNKLPRIAPSGFGRVNEDGTITDYHLERFDFIQDDQISYSDKEATEFWSRKDLVDRTETEFCDRSLHDLLHDSEI